MCCELKSVDFGILTSSSLTVISFSQNGKYGQTFYIVNMNAVRIMDMEGKEEHDIEMQHHGFGMRCLISRV